RLRRVIEVYPTKNKTARRSQDRRAFLFNLQDNSTSLIPAPLWRLSVGHVAAAAIHRGLESRLAGVLFALVDLLDSGNQGARALLPVLGRAAAGWPVLGHIVGGHRLVIAKQRGDFFLACLSVGHLR